MIRVTKTDRWGSFTSEVIFMHGVYVWASNGSVPPEDAIREYGIDKLPNFDKATHDRVREKQVAGSLERYREMRAKHGYSDEERAEMRAAFGPNCDVVDVITGKRILT